MLPCRHTGLGEHCPFREERQVMSSAFDDARPEIEYPCRWEYKTIGSSQELMQAAIVEVLADLDYTVDFSNVSRTGKYCSLVVVVTVDSEEHRNSIFAALRTHRHIRMVL